MPAVPDAGVLSDCALVPSRLPSLPSRIDGDVVVSWKPAERLSRRAMYLSWSTWLMAKSTMNSAMRTVIMSA